MRTCSTWAAKSGVDDGFDGEGQEGEGQGREDDQDAGGDDPPPVANVECAGLESGLEELAPGGDAGIAEAEEAEAGFGQDGTGGGEDHLGDDKRRNLGEDVADHNPGPGGAQGAGRFHELTGSDLEDHRADDDGQAGPGEGDEDEDDQPQV